MNRSTAYGISELSLWTSPNSCEQAGIGLDSYLTRLLKLNLECIEFGNPNTLNDFIRLRLREKSAATSVTVHTPVLSAFIPSVEQLDAIHPPLFQKISLYISTSESYSSHYFSCSVNQRLKEIETICELARSHTFGVRIYIGCAYSCPHEGSIQPQTVAGLAAKLLRSGCSEFFLIDEQAKANPVKTVQLIHVLSAQIAKNRIGFYFTGDARLAAENIVAAKNTGITRFCGAIGGLGYPPYGDRSHRNIDTELLAVETHFTDPHVINEIKQFIND